MTNYLVLRLKRMLYSIFDLFELRERRAIRRSPIRPQELARTFAGQKLKVGIAREKWNLHKCYVTACVELGMSYEVLDFFSHDWLGELSKSDVDFVLVRPSVQYSPWKDMFDNRLHLLSKYTTTKVFPSVESLWLWESKLRTVEWFRLNGIPAPRTHIFYDRGEALRALESLPMPLVYKASSGSGASGVKLLRSKSDAVSVVRRAFGRGIGTYRKRHNDREHGFVILQEYIQGVSEWRIIRIGAYYFGYEKVKKGDFHSGSQTFSYGRPPTTVLDFVRQLTDEHSFHFVNIDVFVTMDGVCLANEVQPYFGQKDDRELLRINGESGALTYDSESSEWRFRPGLYCRNNLANLRIEEIVRLRL